MATKLSQLAATSLLGQDYGVSVNSAYHCDTMCRDGSGEPTDGRYAFFDCADADAEAGEELETMTMHTVLVNGEELMEVILFTNAANWQASDGENTCAMRKHPKNEAVEGDFAVGDTWVFADPDGVTVDSIYHCSNDCREGLMDPTEGKYMWFDCDIAEYWAGIELEHQSQHTVIVNGWEKYNVKIFTNALEWEGSDGGDSTCVARVNPKKDSGEGQFAVGDTFVFEQGVKILSADGWYGYFDCDQQEEVYGEALNQWDRHVVEIDGDEVEVIGFTEASGQQLDCAGDYGCQPLNWETNDGDCAYRAVHWGAINDPEDMEMTWEDISSVVYV